MQFPFLIVSRKQATAVRLVLSAFSQRKVRELSTKAHFSLEWLLEGFRYELESTAKPRTVKYYYGEISRFLRWADAAGVASDIRLLTN